MTAQTCPHCSAPVRGDGRPACLCAAAGAVDFDPLRVRPYVSLAGQDGGGEEREGPWSSVGPGCLRGGGPDGSTETRTPAAVAPPAAARPRRSGPVSRTFTLPEVAPAVPAVPAGPAAPRKRAIPAVLAVTGAAVAATAVLIGSEVLSGGERDRAAPPDRGTVAPTAAFPTHGDPRPSETGTPSAPATRPTPTRHPGSGPAAARITGTPYRTAAPRPPAPTHASGSVGSAPAGRPSTAPTGPIVLREGSRGPEVAELQDRLRQLGRYVGYDDGRYDADVRDAVARYQEAYGVTGDPEGVYGERTRALLESQTQEP